MVRRINASSSSRLLWTVPCLALCAMVALMTAPMTAPAQSADSAPTSGAARSTFVVAPTIALSAAPTSVAVGDLNGDGKPDLVITKKGSGSVTVFLGDGEGGFDAGVEYAAGTAPGNVLLKDLSGHGRLDVVVTDSATGAIDVLRGNGDGTLEKPESYAATANPIGIASGKFTGNGSIDLAVASATGIAILANDGSGHYSTASTVPFSHQAVSLTVTDLKGVGHDDLIAANADGTVTVLLADGSGHFKTLAPTKVGSGPLTAVLAGDFNHDGKADLAAIQAGSNTLTVLLGRGDGTFDPGVDYAVGNGPASLIVADVKGEGGLDLIAVNRDENTFSVLQGKGDGTFEPAVDYTAGNSPVAVAAGDFNGDGHTDFAVLNSGDRTISLPLGHGDGTFDAAPSYRTQLEQKAIATGDLNGDGRADLVVTNFCGNDRTCKSNGTADVLLANADGTYRHASTYSLGSGPVAVALADLNGDKKLDLIAINRDDKTLTVMPGLGKGKFGDPQTYSLAGSPRALFVGDFNGDGRPDVAIATDCGRNTCSEPGNLDIWLGSGEGKLALKSSYVVGYSPDSIAAGDLRSTGHLDLLVANRCGDDSSCKSHGTASLLKGDGKGKFSDGGEIDLGVRPSSIAISNLTGKGLDLVVANRGSDEVAVLHGDGKGGFGAPATYKVGLEPSALAIADFNGDGRPDVAVANFKSSTVSVLYGTSKGSLKPAITLPVGAGPESLVAVSNGKGAPSGLVTANGNSGATPMGADVTALLHVHADAGSTPSTTMLTGPSPTTSIVDQPVSMTATVSSAAEPPTPSGFVIFSSNGTDISDCGGTTGLSLSGGTVTCTTQTLKEGSNSLVASYQGDTTYDTSDSSGTTVKQTVTAATTITTLGSSDTSAALNEALTFTATVAVTPAESGSIVPYGGTVKFVDDGTTIPGCGTQSVNTTTGVATCGYSALVGGSHSIVAVYSGDTDYLTSTGAVTETVAPVTTTTTISSSDLSSTVNESVTFTSITKPFTGTPVGLTGSVTFTDNGNPADCTVAFDASTGTATCAVSTLTLGPHSIVATYNADGSDTSYKTSVSTPNPLAQAVGKGSTTVGITSSQNPSAINQSVIFTATVTPSPTGTTALSGSVSFADTPPGGTQATIANCGSMALSNVGGKFEATCTTSTLILGTHTITATYGSDPNFTGNTITLSPSQVVNTAKGTITVASNSAASGSPSLPTSSVNQSVMFTATLPAPPGNATLKGTVQFTDTPSGGTATTICTGILPTAGFTASCTTNALTASGTVPAAATTHVITASYGGDPNFTLNNGTVTQRVNPGATGVTVVTSGSPSSVNASVTFTATLTTPQGGISIANNTETVTFTDTPQGGTAGPISCVSSTPGSAQPLNSIGSGSYQATCITPNLALGSHTIKAAYNGDGNFSAISNTVPQTVTAASSNITLTSSTEVGTTSTSTVNQTVKFFANIPVPSGSATLTGTVQFTDAPPGGTAAVISGCNAVKPVATSSTNWIATCSDTALTATVQGTFHAIAASYGHDSNFQVGSGSLSQIVNPAATSVVVASSADPSPVNSQVIFTATISAPSGSIPLTGTVAFTDTTPGGTATPIAGCGAATLSTSGGNTIATCATSTLALGSHTITGTYANDSNFLTSHSTVVQTVTVATTSLVLTSSIAQPTVSQPVTFTATFSVPIGTLKPSGVVTFKDKFNNISSTICSNEPLSLQIGTQTITATATCLDASLAAGNHTITGTYSGDNNFTINNGTVTQQVIAPATKTALVSSSSLSVVTGNPTSFVRNPNNVNDSVTFTATVSPITGSIGSVGFTGTVTFLANGKPVPDNTCSSGTLPGVVNIVWSPGSSSGTASCTTSSLPAGPDTVVATYGSDPNFQSSPSNTVVQDVQDYSLVISSAPPVAVSQGYTTTSDQFTSQTISVAPAPIANAGFSTTADKPLNLLCTVSDLAGQTGKTPACKLYILGTTSAGSTLPVVSSGTQQSLGVLIDATGADPGSYAVTVTGTDPTTGLVHSAEFPVEVRFLSSPLSFQSGATTGNSATVSFILPPKVTLSSMACLYIAGTGITSTTEAPGRLGISCSITPSSLGVATAASAQNVTASVTVSTNNTPTTAGLAKHTSLLIAGLFGIPIFTLIGFRRRRGTAAAIFRLFAILAVSAAAFVPMGCGGTVHTTTPSTGGTTPPGEYFLLIQGQGSDHNTYSTVLQVDVEL
ncbi:MAG: Ig-like domain repeat protein [Terracidiphilus sp.]